MPIVIDEVLITVEVGQARGGGDAPAGAAAAPGAGTAGAASGDRQALIAECVERVLEILERRKEP